MFGILTKRDANKIVNVFQEEVAYGQRIYG
jgi:hypothetical protein